MSAARPEEPLTGGGVTAVVRRGEHVLRARGAHSDRVAMLLHHLRERGFTGAPRHHGVDERGRDVLDFLPGEVTIDPPSDAGIVSAARLLRGLHDATADIAATWRDGWLLPAREPPEVICHGDFATYNVVFDGDRAVGVIDFDTAHPGPRAGDVAYAVYRFAPWTGDGPAVAEQARRAALFRDAYGDTGPGLARIAAERLRALVAYMYEQASAGSAAFAEHIARGDAETYERDIAHIERHAAALAP